VLTIDESWHVGSDTNDISDESPDVEPLSSQPPSVSFASLVSICSSRTNLGIIVPSLRSVGVQVGDSVAL
jgi:hypothetical protein